LGAPEVIKNPKLLMTVADTNTRLKLLINISEANCSDSRLESMAKETKKKHAEMFTEALTPTTVCSMTKHKIDTENHQPIRQIGEKVPLHLQEQVQEEIDKLITQGIIRESSGACRSRLVVVPKEKNKTRMWIDFRALNEATKKNAYPLPQIDGIRDLLAGAEVFSVIDSTSEYHQVAMEEKDMCKTAFAWKGKLYKYTRMPFRLCNAPATFQFPINTILEKAN
jgi:hypothetical protein